MQNGVSIEPEYLNMPVHITTTQTCIFSKVYMAYINLISTRINRINRAPLWIFRTCTIVRLQL